MMAETARWRSGGIAIEETDEWKAAECIASLQGEVERLTAENTKLHADAFNKRSRYNLAAARVSELQSAVTDTIGMIRDWADAEGFPVESSACFQRLSAALSQHPGEEDA
jgi:hypothetical protein